MNLTTLATPHSAFGGTVTFYLMPYRTLNSDLVIAQLQRFEPMWQWRHPSSGELTTDEPADWKAARDRGQTEPPHSEWQRERLWTIAHDTFCLPDAMTVDIEFAPVTDQTPRDIRMLSEYWRCHQMPVRQRWDVFRQLISGPVIDAWWEAYRATRDERMDAPSELQAVPESDADPNG